MNQFVQLESEKYWAEVQAERNRALRYQRNAELREQWTFRAVLAVGFAALAVATASGVFGDLDLDGAVRQMTQSFGLNY